MGWVGSGVGRALCVLYRYTSTSAHGSRIRKQLVDEGGSHPDVVHWAAQAGTGELPPTLLRKYKTPVSVYVATREAAQGMAGAVRDRLGAGPLVEVNPGPGVLSRALLTTLPPALRLHQYEVSSQFTSYLQKLQEEYPDRINYKVADFFGMWKLAFQDKMDNGNRIKDLLGGLSNRGNADNIQIVGAMLSYNFIKHLIFTILFHNTNNLLGKPNLFIAMPIANYEYLKGTHGFSKNRLFKSTPSLFQILFDHQVLLKLPRTNFLPWQVSSSKTTNNTLADEDTMYLVNITQKEKLPCSPDYLPLLWYFFKPHTMSRNIRVIPCLEQWIPGCGVWLISGQDPPDTNKQLSPDKDDAALPHMTIFTQFGDLSLEQKITVFKRFISWPEFEHCPFRSSMENNLPKSLMTIDVDEKDPESLLDGASIEDTEGDAVPDTEEEKHV